MKKIVLFGPPASGKGTQSELLAEHFGIPTCSTGAMLREEIEKGTELGVEADRFLSKGQFLPDDLMVEALKGWLICREDDTEETLHLRLVEYREKTAPLIDYYRDAGIFVRINGDQSAEFVFKEISAVMVREKEEHKS